MKFLVGNAFWSKPIVCENSWRFFGAPGQPVLQQDRHSISQEMAEPDEFSPAEPVDYLWFSSVERPLVCGFPANASGRRPRLGELLPRTDSGQC